MMKRIYRKFYEITDVNNVKVCNIKLKFDEIPNIIHLP